MNKKAAMSLAALLGVAGVIAVFMALHKPAAALAMAPALTQCLTGLSDAGFGKEPIRPIPLSLALNKEKVALGEELFNEPKLSHDDSISCAYCLDLSLGGTDRKVHSLGSGGRSTRDQALL
jgi:cytochrome c peroxidase